MVNAISNCRDFKKIDLRRMSINDLENLFDGLNDREKNYKQNHFVDRYKVDELTSCSEDYTDAEDEPFQEVQEQEVPVKEPVKVQEVKEPVIETPVKVIKTKRKKKKEKKIKPVIVKEVSESEYDTDDEEDENLEYKQPNIKADTPKISRQIPKPTINIKLFEKEAMTCAKNHRQEIRMLLKDYKGNLDSVDKEYLREDYNNISIKVESDLEYIDKILEDNGSKFNDTFQKKISNILSREMERVKKKL